MMSIVARDIISLRFTTPVEAFLGMSRSIALLSCESEEIKIMQVNHRFPAKQLQMIMSLRGLSHSERLKTGLLYGHG
jgi:hypothetical protein